MIMKIYGDEQELHEINSDHVQRDIISHQILNGKQFMIHLQHGNLQQNEQISVVLMDE